MPELETRIAPLLRRWSESRSRGIDLTPEELCADAPELLESVRTRIETLSQSEDLQTTRIRSPDADVSDTREFPPVPALPPNSYEEFSTIPEGGPTGIDAERFELRQTFQELKLHAKGGLGEVYAANDEDASRRVAVKTIRAELAGEEDLHVRLMMEAEITARLDHPGVVPVYGLGRSSAGRSFYAMQFVEGRTLDDAIRDHYRPENSRDRSRRAARFNALLRDFASVCKTIAYAHNRGIVHRDIKPHNILLGRFGETLVADWGLAMPVVREDWARASGEQTLALNASLPATEAASGSTSGSGAGTPAYMSPEQAIGTENVGPASDIYNLGATLYKIVTGRAPFSGRNVETMMQRVSVGEYQPASRVNKNVPPPLEAICTKAMALQPNDRYRTAMELAEEVERFLSDEKVEAYSEPMLASAARWTRKHRAATQAVVAATLLITVCGIGAAVVLGRQAAREFAAHEQAEIARDSERELREKSLQVSAEFAARGLANQIDVRWRVLERLAANPALPKMLAEINADTDKAESREPLQEWIDEAGSELADRIPSRAIFVNAVDGTQVARYPLRDDDGEVMRSIGNRYAFRDYFHGDGSDLDPGQDKRPFEKSVHLSAAHESSNDGDLNVVFGTSIKDPASGGTIGILSMSVSIGEFADLEVALPKGQSVLLVDTRQYTMDRSVPEPHKEWSYGLVLHRPGLVNLEARHRLPRVGDEILERLHNRTTARDNLLPESYRDPFTQDPKKKWIAAYSTVVVGTRPPEIGRTGWVVIVQQEQGGEAASTASN